MSIADPFDLDELQEDVAEFLKHYQIIKSRSDPASQNRSHSDLSIRLPKSLRLPKPPVGIEIPPRQREPSRSHEDYRASAQELEESLEYYERAREKYLLCEKQSQRLRANLTSEVYTAVNKEVVNEESNIEEESEKETPDDVFLEFIDNIIRTLQKLLVSCTHKFDHNWKSMIRELDIDEGWFTINIIKTHEGGDLYKFLCTVGGHLGEHRMLEAYMLYNKEELDDFRKIKYKNYEDYPGKIDWQELFKILDADMKIYNKYLQKVRQYEEVLIRVRANEMSDEVWKRDYPLPEKPHTPYLDDIVRASVDSGLHQYYFMEEIVILAARDAYGCDMIRHTIENEDFEELWSYIKEDLHTLHGIYQNHHDLTRYVDFRDHIRRFRGLFFEMHPTEISTRGDMTFLLKETAQENLRLILNIMSNPDEEQKLHDFGELIRLRGEHFENEYGDNGAEGNEAETLDCSISSNASNAS